MIRGLLFDLDGTLLSTNDTHVRTWQEAFRTMGFWVGRERIEREIGPMRSTRASKTSLLRVVRR